MMHLSHTAVLAEHSELRPAPQLACSRCGWQAQALDWRCNRCGGPLEITNLPVFRADLLAHERSMWRYQAMLPARRIISLGEGGTPLEPITLHGISILAKLEYFAPTASYKDRGTALLVNHLLSNGVQAVAEDSSGNAGASLAAYAAAAGFAARVYVPAHASAAKRQQISCFGAELLAIDGPRSAASSACEAAVEHEQLVYASHAWNPFCIAGHMTCAWEMWEQLGRTAPDALICPVGQGNLLLGLARGFAALAAAGFIEQQPRLFAIQAAACAPIAEAWAAGHNEVQSAFEQPTRAEGIRIAAPIRGNEVLAAVRASNGAALAVDESAISAAQHSLMHQGILIEPTSAVAAAAVRDVRAAVGPNAQIVLVLTGSGLKALA